VCITLPPGDGPQGAHHLDDIHSARAERFTLGTGGAQPQVSILILHAELRFSNQGAYSQRFSFYFSPWTGGGTYPALEAQRSFSIRQCDQLIP
jgi:hypothetical protein